MKRMSVMVIAAMVLVAGSACSQRSPYGQTKLRWNKDYRTMSVNILDHTYTGEIQRALEAELGFHKLINNESPMMKVGGEFKTEGATFKSGKRTWKCRLDLTFTSEGQPWRVPPIEWEAKGTDERRAVKESVEANLERVVEQILAQAEKR